MQEMLVPGASAAGWAGALCTAAAYGLVSRRRVEPDSRLFQTMNILGGALLAISAAASGAWPSVTSNFVWILIGLHALVGMQCLPRAARTWIADRMSRRRTAADGVDSHANVVQNEGF
jgi:hypothetical protein